MRLFVGTLYTIENEFDECVASIALQSYRNFQHFVFRNLPNKEAHDALYSAFMLVRRIASGMTKRTFYKT